MIQDIPPAWVVKWECVMSEENNSNENCSGVPPLEENTQDMQVTPKPQPTPTPTPPPPKD